VDPEASKITSGTGKRAKGPGQQPARVSESVEGCTIQGVSGRMVSVLGGDSIRHCEKNSSYEHVSNCEWLPR
jgi:hypothetical protein